MDKKEAGAMLLLQEVSAMNLDPENALAGQVNFKEFSHGHKRREAWH